MKSLMKSFGFWLLLLLTAAVGAAAYFTRQLDLSNIFSFNTPLTRLLLILIVVLASQVVIKIGVWLIEKYAKGKDKAELKQITSVYRYGIDLALVFVVLGLLYGVIGPIVTSIGLLAAGLTVALQKPILNLAGWLSIVTKRPYKIGDRVDIGSIGGYVHEIALMHTHLSLVENNEQTGKVSYVPNEQVLTQPIVNYTKGSQLVWDQVRVRVPPKANIKSVEKRLLDCAEEVVGKEMKAASKKWKAEVRPETRVSLDYTPTTQPFVEIAVRYLCNSKNIQATKTEVTRKVIERFKKELKG